MISASPIVPRAASVVCYEDIFVIVKIAIFAVLNAVDHSRLQVHQQGSWNVVLVVRLIEEHILPISSLMPSISFPIIIKDRVQDYNYVRVRAKNSLVVVVVCRSTSSRG